MSRRLAPFGWNVVLVTGDYRDGTPALMRGDFDLAIVVYEKFERWVTRRLDQMASVGLIVCDELQLIYDSQRGAPLEIALTMLGQLAERPPLLGLSAVLPDPEKLARWLRLRCLRDYVRPSELRLGVYHDGVFRFREETSGREGEEAWPGTVGREPGEQMVEIARDAVARGEQVIVFLESRAACQKLARHLADRLSLPAAENPAPLSRVASITSERLQACLDRGVAFHHAGLTAPERAAVERLVRDGRVRILCATGTLAAGVNLPADTVIIRPFRYVTGSQQRQPVRLPLPWSDFRNRAGRAGRFGMGGKPGRAILLADTPLEAEILWQEFVAGRPQPRSSRLQNVAPARVLLEFVVAGSGRSTADLERLWQATLHASHTGATHPDADALARELAVDGFVRATAAGRLAATGLGEATVHSGITLASARAFAEAVTDPGYDEIDPWLRLLLDLDEAADLQWPPVPRRTGGEFSAPAIPSSRQRVQRMLDLVRAWRQGETSEALERRFGLPLGIVAQNARSLAWLLESAARVAMAARGPEPRARLLLRTSFEIKYGLPFAARHWVRRSLRFLGRDDILELLAAGLNSPRQWQAAIADGRPLNLSVALIDLLTNYKESGDTMHHTPTGHRTVAAAPDVAAKLAVEGTLQGERREVRWGGRRIALTPKCFKFLAKLAVCAAVQPSRWVTREELEHGDNQARYLHRLKGELEAQCADIPPLWENNRRGGYRLCLSPEQLSINWNELLDFDDYDLVQWVERFRPVQTARPRLQMPQLGNSIGA